ncbi:MAG: FtsX-like permease family protein [Anaerolineales bacterium]|nr:MAG: FtsX-like permease family protein [Anaerolineales bacterium]
MIGNIQQILRAAWDGLSANKMRSALTMLGVIIGVGAVIALLSLGEGAQAEITRQISSIGTNLVFVAPGSMQSQRPGQSSAGLAATLTYDDALAAADPRNVPDAKIVAPEYTSNAQIIFGDADINTAVVGTTPVYAEAFTLQVESGRFLEDADVNGRASVAVLGSDAATDLFGGFDPLGQKVRVTIPGTSGGRVSLTVVGVLTEKGGTSMGTTSSDDTVFVPISTAQTRLFNARNPWGELIVTRINAVATSEDTAEAVEAQLEALLRGRHDFTEDEDADFMTVSQADILDMANQVTAIMTAFLGAVAGISLLVGGIGIMNIMLVSVTERTREIGLRKAVGARRNDILIQFLTEAVVLSLLGGMIGTLFGAGLAGLVALTGVVDALITVNSILLAVGFSFAVGLFFGIYPANQAARLNPIDALRYE